MPFIELNTNCTIENEVAIEIKEKLGKAIETLPGKSEDWLMININDNQNIYFKGTSEKACMIKVLVFGKPSDESLADLTGKISELIETKLKINKNRIYVYYNFTKNWGWNGNNF